MNALTSSQGDQTPIDIVEHTDSVCAPCPHKRDLRCTSQDKITALDHAHAEALDLHPNQTLTWGQAKERLSSHLTIEKFDSICANCEWKPYGICESVIKTNLIK